MHGAASLPSSLGGVLRSPLLDGASFSPSLFWVVLLFSSFWVVLFSPWVVLLSPPPFGWSSFLLLPCLVRTKLILWLHISV